MYVNIAALACSSSNPSKSHDLNVIIPELFCSLCVFQLQSQKRKGPPSSYPPPPEKKLLFQYVSSFVSLPKNKE